MDDAGRVRDRRVRDPCCERNQSEAENEHSARMASKDETHCNFLSQCWFRCLSLSGYDCRSDRLPRHRGALPISATAPPIFFCRVASTRLDYSTKSGDGIRFPPAALEDAWQRYSEAEG